MIGKPIVQSIKLATCNIGIWPISDKLITTQATVIDCYWLAQQPWTDVTHATFPIIVHTLLHIRHVIELSHACHCFLCHYAICKKTGKRHWRERREYCSPADVQSIKMKCVYNYCVQLQLGFLCVISVSVNLQPVITNWCQFIYRLVLIIDTNR